MSCMPLINLAYSRERKLLNTKQSSVSKYSSPKTPMTPSKHSSQSRLLIQRNEKFLPRIESPIQKLKINQFIPATTRKEKLKNQKKRRELLVSSYLSQFEYLKVQDADSPKSISPKSKIRTPSKSSRSKSIYSDRKRTVNLHSRMLSHLYATKPLQISQKQEELYLAKYHYLVRIENPKIGIQIPFYKFIPSPSNFGNNADIKILQQSQLTSNNTIVYLKRIVIEDIFEEKTDKNQSIRWFQGEREGQFSFFSSFSQQIIIAQLKFPKTNASKLKAFTNYFLYSLISNEIKDGMTFPFIKILNSPIVYLYQQEQYNFIQLHSNFEQALLQLEFEDFICLHHIFLKRHSNNQIFEEAEQQKIFEELISCLITLEKLGIIFLNLNLHNVFFSQSLQQFKLFPQNNIFYTTVDQSIHSNQANLKIPHLIKQSQLTINYRTIHSQQLGLLLLQLRSMKTDQQIMQDDVFLDNQLFQFQLDQTPFNQIISQLISAKQTLSEIHLQYLGHTQQLLKLKSLNSLFSYKYQKEDDELSTQTAQSINTSKRVRFLFEENQAEEILTMKSQMELAEAYMQTFQYHQACKIYEDHKQKVKELFGVESKEYYQLCSKLFQLQMQVHSEDEEHFLEFIQIKKANFAITIQEQKSIALDYFIYGNNCQYLKKLTLAKESFQEAIKYYERCLGKFCNEIAIVVNALVSLYFENQDFGSKKDLEYYLEYCLYIFVKLQSMQLPLEYYSFWISFCNIGKQKYMIKEYDQTIQFLEKAQIVHKQLENQLHWKDKERYIYSLYYLFKSYKVKETGQEIATTTKYSNEYYECLNKYEGRAKLEFLEMIKDRAQFLVQIGKKDEAIKSNQIKITKQIVFGIWTKYYEQVVGINNLTTALILKEFADFAYLQKQVKKYNFKYNKKKTAFTNYSESAIIFKNLAEDNREEAKEVNSQLQILFIELK